MLGAPPCVGVEQIADIRIGIPEEACPSVTLEVGAGGLTLDLPKGATFPVDIVAASGGMLREAQIVPGKSGRTRVVMTLASGLLDAVDVQRGAVVLRLARRGTGVGDEPDATAFRLGPDDRIQVTIGGRPELSGQLVVNSAGAISAPLVGEVRVAGLTTRALASRLAELLARDYLVDPQVDVQVVEYRSQWVLVTGGVRTPGRVSLRGGTTLKDVLSDAGGLSSEAGDEILISREGEGGAAASEIRVTREDFERGAVNPPVVHGDIVNVRPATYFYIHGEVRNSSRFRAESGMTLLKAIALAGGLTEWANRHAIQILLEGSDAPPQAYNLKAIESRKTPDPPIRGGEIIIVKRRVL